MKIFQLRFESQTPDHKSDGQINILSLASYFKPKMQILAVIFAFLSFYSSESTIFDAPEVVTATCKGQGGNKKRFWDELSFNCYLFYKTIFKQYLKLFKIFERACAPIICDAGVTRGTKPTSFRTSYISETTSSSKSSFPKFFN